MSLSSIARSKKRTGELSFATKVELYKASVGDEAFAEQQDGLLFAGKALYNQLRIDGVLPKRAKAWEKLDYQDQLKWGASASDVFTDLEKAEKASSGFVGAVQKVMGALAPAFAARSVAPEMVAEGAVKPASLEELLRQLNSDPLSNPVTP